MAKFSKAVLFRNATICKEDMTITEIIKDETKIYDLNKVLSDWNGIEGVSISIKFDDDLPEDGENFD